VLRLINRRQLGPNDFERRTTPDIDDLLAADTAGDAPADHQTPASDANLQSPIIADLTGSDDFDDFSGWPPTEPSALDDAPSGEIESCDAPPLALTTPASLAGDFPRGSSALDVPRPEDEQRLQSSDPPPPGDPHVRPPPLVGVFLGDAGRRIFLSELFRRLRERVYYPPRGSAWEVRDIIGQQVYHLARVIEGRDADYLPFVPAGN
jgi:hypothetical protein